MEFRIISIGALSRHELRADKGPVRTAHATTSLLCSDKQIILVDPGLPAPALAAHLVERSGLEPADVTDIFLTNFRPAHRRGIRAFEHARWLISESERDTVGACLLQMLREGQDDSIARLLKEDLATLKRCQVAPDRIAPAVDLFPLPGFSPGTCGLLLSGRRTTLIASDAVPTVEHLEQGRVLRGCYDVEQAQQSLMEAVEIADQIVPGHDNIVTNPTRRPF